MIIEKCVNIPIIQKSFTNIFKTIKTSVKIIVIITVKNKVMHNTLTCQITSTKKMNLKICKTFPMFLSILKKVSMVVRFWKVEGNYT